MIYDMEIFDESYRNNMTLRWAQVESERHKSWRDAYLILFPDEECNILSNGDKFSIPEDLIRSVNIIRESFYPVDISNYIEIISEERQDDDS